MLASECLESVSERDVQRSPVGDLSKDLRSREGKSN